MGNKYRKPPSDLIRSQLEIQDRIGLLESTPRASSTSVDTGHFRFKASNGVTMVDFGDQGPGLGRGYVFRRGEGGEPAFYLGNNQATGTQFWVLADNAANIIASDDAQSGQGLARPYIPYTATKFSDVGAPAQTTTSTSFVGAYSLYGFKQHPQMEVQYIVTTPAGVSAQVAIVDTSNSNIVAGPNTHGPSSFVIGTLKGPIDGGHLNHLNHDLQYRVSAGAGTIGVTLIYAYGVQS